MDLSSVPSAPPPYQAMRQQENQNVAVQIQQRSPANLNGRNIQEIDCCDRKLDRIGNCFVTVFNPRVRLSMAQFVGLAASATALTWSVYYSCNSPENATSTEKGLVKWMAIPASLIATIWTGSVFFDLRC